MRLCIGTRAQKCHKCEHNLKKEPFIRLDNIVHGYPSWKSVNLCFRCIDKMNKEVKKALRNKDIASEMFLHKMS